MTPIYRLLLRVVLAATTLGLAAASYAREGMSPLDVLPTLVSPTPWRDASIPLGIVTIVNAVFGLILAHRSRFFAADQWLIVETSAVMAALTTYSYDLCENIGLTWLPTFGGCHCWLTGAAALCTAGLSTLVFFAIGLISVKCIQAICRAHHSYLKRRLHRLFLECIFLPTARRQPSVRIRLIAFRGPPISAL